MQTLADIGELRAVLRHMRSQGLSIGLVPTMGYLHAGHLSLIELARRDSQRVVVSIFVNPLQFNEKGDFEKYPVDLCRDTQLLEKVGVDLLFVPSVERLYQTGHQSRVNVPELSREHEGRFRPGHFEGVTTIVAMLFNLVGPDFAVFGEKDFQQLRVIEQMVEDLKFDVSIIRGPTVREADGLAMSSRNVRLSAAGRAAAVCLSRGLMEAKRAFESGERIAARLTDIVLAKMHSSALVRPEYVHVVDQKTLKKIEIATEQGQGRIVVAAYVEGVRLIDNVGL